MDIPAGNIAKTHSGGPNELRPVIERVKKFGFTGYVRVIHGGETGTEGLIFLLDGETKLYLYRNRDGGQETRGHQAMKAIYESGALLSSTIEIHTNVDVTTILDNLEKQVPAAAASRRSSRRAILAWGKTTQKKEGEEIKAVRTRLEEINASGYSIDVEALLKGDDEAIRKNLADMEEAVNRMEEEKRRLKELEPMLSKEDIKTVEALFRDPLRISEVESILGEMEKKADRTKREEEEKKAIEELKELSARKEEKERKEKAEQVYDLVIKYQGEGGKEKTGEKAEEGKEEEEEKRCLRCGELLDDLGACKRCSEDTSSKKHLATNLHADYTFDNFVIGNSNHFAHAAAVAVAEEPATTYNPLFIWSGPGLGKTHLINAIANQIISKHPGMRISYFTTEQFISDLVEHMKKGTLDEFRTEYRQADILVVDDIQFLAESERAQEEFFHTFNSLYTVDKQIVLASDRPPKEIPTLKQRLVSRFEGGLIVEIQLPDYETRLAILQQKQDHRGLHVDEEVIALIARSITSNIRELEGSLNKVVAFSSFTNREMDLELAREVLSDLISEEEEEGEKEASEKKKRTKGKAKASEKKKQEEELRPGHSYLVEENTLKGAVRLFKKTLSSENAGKGMAVIRTNPSRVEREHKIKHLADIYWLTDRDSKKNKTIQPALEKLMWEMGGFLEDNENGVVLLDGLDYLASSNSFDSVTKFLRRMVDTVAETDAVLIVSLSPDTLDKQQVKILEREMDVLSYL